MCADIEDFCKKKLSPVCNSIRMWPPESTRLTPHTCTTSISNCRCGHYDSSNDSTWKQARGRLSRLALHAIPVQRPFQIVDVDIMDLTTTQHGNTWSSFKTSFRSGHSYSQYLTRRLTHLYSCWLRESFLCLVSQKSDRGTILLSHLMRDVCAIMGIEKLNTIAYHPACNGIVKWFIRTLKIALCKDVDRFGCQCDCVLWAYHNTQQHNCRKTLLFGIDLWVPTEAALLPPTSVTPTDVDDYREKLMLSLSSARDVATQSIRKAQEWYKQYYDKKATSTEFKLGQWVLVRFPQE